MAIGSTSPFDHNVFAAASGLTSSPWAKQPNHSYIHKAETQTFNAPATPTPSAPTTPKKRWKKVHSTTATTNPVPANGKVDGKTAFKFTTKYCSRPSTSTKGYTVCPDVDSLFRGKTYRSTKSGAGKLVPAKGYRLTGAMYVPTGKTWKGWKGNYSNPATGESATHDGRTIRFTIAGSGSKIEFDVDGKHGSYGNSITFSNGVNRGWDYPNETITIAIWSVDKEEQYCTEPQYMVGSFTKPNMCKSRGCKQSAYTEYTPLDVISMSSLCKTCKNTGGTGYTVDKNCKMIATAGYIIKNGEAMKRGCTNQNYDEYESGVYSDSSYCKTCKDKGGTGYTVGADCKRIAKPGYRMEGNVAKTVGCQDATYAQYDSASQIGDSSLCLTCKQGLVSRDGKCKKPGCTDTNATNYDNNAEFDNGSCTCGTGFAKDPNSLKCVVSGCTDKGDTAYNSKAVIHSAAACSGTCKSGYEIQNGKCVIPAKQGCMDSDADNYDSEAAVDDGSCTYSCGDENRVTTDKGTCGDTCNDGYSLVNGVCEEIVEEPDDDALEPANGDTPDDTTDDTPTTGDVGPAPAGEAKKSPTGLIIGGVAVVAVLGIMMMRKKAPAAAEWYGY